MHVDTSHHEFFSSFCTHDGFYLFGFLSGSGSGFRQNQVWGLRGRLAWKNKENKLTQGLGTEGTAEVEMTERLNGKLPRTGVLADLVRNHPSVTASWSTEMAVENSRRATLRRFHY